MNWDGSPSIDAAGNYLDTYQTINGGRYYSNPNVNYVDYGFGRVPLGDPLAGIKAALSSANTPAPTPPQFQFTFDTIGQVIFRSIGHCRLPLRIIWAQGINESGDTSVSSTQTFAAALCAPIDPDEEGEIISIWDSGSVVFGDGGPVIPDGWTEADAALLENSLNNIIIYPGDEAQLPDSLIVADKGADKTNAFRGIRYIIFPDYPIKNGIPQLSAGFQRTNDEPVDSGAVEFSSGSD